MFIVSKDKKAIINTEQITSIYIGADGCTIKADFENGKGCQIARYNSEKASQIAIDIISNSFGKSEICFMPEESDINAKLNIMERREYHITGKKTKGHGGS